MQETIQTTGITKQRPDPRIFQERPGGYFLHDKKLIKKEALHQLHPELFLEPDTFETKHNGFGTQFPKSAAKGEVFVRVDSLPNRVFKFDGFRWVEISKGNSDSYLYNEGYIKFLVDKISKGEYDVDQLTDIEKSQIEEYLTKNS